MKAPAGCAPSDFVAARQPASRRIPAVAGANQGSATVSAIDTATFTASSLLGTPQGLSVFQAGVRINEAFADVVNSDLLPKNAIASMQLLPGSHPVRPPSRCRAFVGAPCRSGRFVARFRERTRAHQRSRLGRRCDADRRRARRSADVAPAQLHGLVRAAVHVRCGGGPGLGPVRGLHVRIRAGARDRRVDGALLACRFRMRSFGAAQRPHVFPTNRRVRHEARHHR